jgi:NADH-ubiquinone oxidoreductase chain 4
MLTFYFWELVLIEIMLISIYLLNTLKGFKLIRVLGLILSISMMIIPLYLISILNNNIHGFQFISTILNFNIGIDGISLIFILLTTLLTPISIISNWNSIKFFKNYMLVLLSLECLLIFIFIILDIFYFYIFFESTLPLLFIFIGIGGNKYKIKASYYIFIYTMLGSLFLLISILFVLKILGGTDFYQLFKSNINFFFQTYIFIGFFIAFAVKAPTILLNNWLLKAHVESPLAGSIILAGIVLKLSLIGIYRLILPILPKSLWYFSVYLGVIGVSTIIIISLSTIRASDIKELIAYSSISHAGVYILGIISNNIQGIEGGILLGLAHGFVSPALFIITGGILYDRYFSRDINSIRGVTQLMPLLSIFFIIFTLSNCGVPLSLNFIGEFLSLYGFFEKLPLLGLMASLSIIFSAVYSIYLYNRIAFGKYLSVNSIKYVMTDLSKREYYILLLLLLLTIVFGILPNIIEVSIALPVSSVIFKQL